MCSRVKRSVTIPLVRSWNHDPAEGKEESPYALIVPPIKRRIILDDTLNYKTNKITE